MFWNSAFGIQMFGIQLLESGNITDLIYCTQYLCVLVYIQVSYCNEEYTSPSILLRLTKYLYMDT